LRVKREGLEADQSPQSSAEFKNDGAIPPLPHMPSWHRDNFSFTKKCTFFPTKYVFLSVLKQTKQLALPKTTGAIKRQEIKIPNGEDERTLYRISFLQHAATEW
jgi:hypothetical protein